MLLLPLIAPISDRVSHPPDPLMKNAVAPSISLAAMSLHTSSVECVTGWATPLARHGPASRGARTYASHRQPPSSQTIGHKIATRYHPANFSKAELRIRILAGALQTEGGAKALQSASWANGGCWSLSGLPGSRLIVYLDQA